MFGTNSPGPISQEIVTRPVKLIGTDPAVYVLVDDRTVDHAVHQELSPDEQAIARKQLLEAAQAAAQA